MKARGHAGKLLLATALSFGCGRVSADGPDRIDGAPDVDFDASPLTDGDLAELGSEENPAASCAELREVLGPESGVYWVEHDGAETSPFEVYCEQELGGGGWAMVVNSVRTAAGNTTEFWQLNYAQRASRKGTMAPNRNFYDGALYLIGTDYMDVIADLADQTAIAVEVTTGGIDPDTMAFIDPALTSGNADVFDNHFAAGWSSADHDGDDSIENCSLLFEGVAQHYRNCWIYSLGADAEEPILDGGVGPHAHGGLLVGLGLQEQAGGGGYSQVSRIARFTRW